MWVQLVKDLNWKIKDINMIINKIPIVSERHIIDQLEKSISLIIAFKLELTSHNGGLSIKHIIENYEIIEWPDQINHIAFNTGFPDDMERQKQDLINELLKNNKGNKRIMSYVHEKLLKTLNKIGKIKEGGWSRIWDSRHKIHQWEENDVKLWSEKWRKLGKQSVIKYVEEVIAVIGRAVEIWFNIYPRDTQIITLLNSGLDKNVSVLHQVNTGEGKTLIIAMLAIFISLQGYTVDIITSSEVLAKRDTEKMSKLYKIFNLTWSHNWKNEGGHKKCYDWDIVYGDISNFQGDHLRHHYEQYNTRGKRPYEKVIIDEVDNMLLDNASHTTMLSKKFWGFEHLNLYMKICWSIFIQFEKQYQECNGKLYWVKNLAICNGKAALFSNSKENIKYEVKNRLEYTVKNLEPIIK